MKKANFGQIWLKKAALETCQPYEILDLPL